MYETAALFEKECAKDLDVLEKALEGAKETPVKNFFQERQVREALERLKGRMYQYETVKKEGALREGEYEALRDMLVRGDVEFLKMAEGLLYRAEGNRMLKFYDIQREFLEIYQRLYVDLMAEYSYFELYFDEFEFARLEGRNIRSMEQLYKVVLDIGGRMLQLTGCFKLDTRSELIGRVADYAWRNVEKKISLEKIAEEFFVNKTYLSHLFKRETGRTFVNFFTEIRMLRSRVLLRQNCRVYECALQLGYEDAEYFSRVFKNYFGCKPTEYMAQMGNDLWDSHKEMMN